MSVKLLEINAVRPSLPTRSLPLKVQESHIIYPPQCPDFTQTGPALQSVIDDLFAAAVRVAVKPFFSPLDAVAGENIAEGIESLSVKDARDGLRKVLETEVSRAW